MRWDSLSRRLIIAGLVGLVSVTFSNTSARMKAEVNSAGLPRITGLEARPIPNFQQCTHRAGRLWLTVTNYGLLGNRSDYLLKDCLTGRPTVSAEFPGDSKIEYLFQGGLWIGSAADKDTSTTVGTDGWFLRSGNLLPNAGFSGEIIRRSINPASPYYDPQAVSDLDLIAVMYDTSSDCYFATCTDPYDGKIYKPRGLKVIQRSYSWATTWGQDWVMLDYQIVNIGQKPLRDVYLGFFVDADVGWIGKAGYELDDLSGFVVSEPNGYRDMFRTPPDNGPLFCQDTIYLAYSADNDGDPDGGAFGSSPTAALGLQIVQLPNNPHLDLKQTTTSFNWWRPDSNATLDWGPQKFPGQKNFAGALGQPTGHRMRYNYLSNGEKDYDQVFAAVNQRNIDVGFGSGWLAPVNPLTSAIDLADGSDTRYLLSFGPFDLPVGDSLPFTLAFVAGEGLHTEANNFAENLGVNSSNYLDTAKINSYIANLDFSAMLDNARMARQVFDHFTDSTRVLCGTVYFGDPFFRSPVRGYHRHGDGIPDLRGPETLPYPPLDFAIGPGDVTIRWFGRQTEAAVDSFTNLKDFEGYRVWMSYDGANFTVVGSYDKVNWKPYYFNTAIKRWRPAPSRPLTYDEIQEIYATRWDTCRNKPGNITRPIDPAKYSVPINNINLLPRVDISRCKPDTTKTAIMVDFCASCGPRKARVDSAFIFVPQDYNLGLEKARIYPAVTDTGSDSAYWYQYHISGLSQSQPVWFAVTPFDFGKLGPNVSVDPVEANPHSVGRMILAVAGDSARRVDSLKISVYPNPYRIDHNYSHYERPEENTGILLSTQKINFINLPPSCIIRIYTLDGDLVQEIKHGKSANASDAGFEQWNLLTRNTQTVAAGLYLFTVQPTGAFSNEKTYIGKIVIIK